MYDIQRLHLKLRRSQVKSTRSSSETILSFKNSNIEIQAFPRISSTRGNPVGPSGRHFPLPLQAGRRGRRKLHLQHVARRGNKACFVSSFLFFLFFPPQASGQRVITSHVCLMQTIWACSKCYYDLQTATVCVCVGGCVTTYLVHENIQGGVDGGPLAAGHGDKSKAHADVEPFAEARSRADVGSSPLLMLSGPGGSPWNKKKSRVKGSHFN